MLKERLEKIKNIFVLKEGENNKKKIENLVVFIVILIITVIIINNVWNSSSDDENKGITNTDKVLAKTNDKKEEINTNDLEGRLEEILSKISGVGNVKVLLTYSESSTTVAIYNEDKMQSDTQETDSRQDDIEK